MIMPKELISTLRKPKTLEELVSELNADEKEILDSIKQAKRKGYEIIKNGEYFVFNPHRQSSRQFYEVKIPKKVKLAFIGDTHIGSKQSRLDLLAEFYKIAEKEGVKYVVHAGDIIDGVNVYSSQIANLKDYTVEAQVERVINEYPKSKLKTFCVTGNHDNKEYEKGRSPHIGRLISSMRKDLIWIGDYDVRLIDPKYEVNIEVIHPAGANSYATSYKPQKLIESMSSGNKPNILLIGHYHDAIYMFYRNIHTLKVGSFQDENDFSLRKGMINTLGGWIVDMEHNGYEITKFKPWLVQFYK